MQLSTLIHVLFPPLSLFARLGRWLAGRCSRIRARDKRSPLNSGDHCRRGLWPGVGGNGRTSLAGPLSVAAPRPRRLRGKSTLRTITWKRRYVNRGRTCFFSCKGAGCVARTRDMFIVDQLLVTSLWLSNPSPFGVQVGIFYNRGSGVLCLANDFCQ